MEIQVTFKLYLYHLFQKITNRIKNANLRLHTKLLVMFKGIYPSRYTSTLKITSIPLSTVLALNLCGILAHHTLIIMFLETSPETQNLLIYYSYLLLLQITLINSIAFLIGLGILIIIC